MSGKTTTIPVKKGIALVAHDHKKGHLMEWAAYNKEKLKKHELYATGTTGKMLEEKVGLNINRFLSGPLGGDQQIGAKIVDGTINFLVFFWDPLEPQPHDPDVKALLRIAAVWNIPIACNRASADFLFTSVLMDSDYEKHTDDFRTYMDREIK
ncbi:MAG TPA: methylglyoxal synthase [Cytophagales bacterium]|jgi:methylglyoxal synthase|nr:methylglyoxal synthase [Cytophagales bacterium]